MSGRGTGRQTAAEMLADILERPVESVPEKASIHNFPAWDSLVHVKLMLALEEATGRPVDPGRMMALADLASIDRYLQDLKPSQS